MKLLIEAEKEHYETPLNENDNNDNNMYKQTARF